MKKAQESTPQKEPSTPASSQRASDAEGGLNRREFLRLGAGTALALPLGAMACSAPEDPEAKKKREEEERKKAEEEQRKKLCTSDANQDNAKETAFAPEGIKQDDTLFALGVQSGAMSAKGALLWTFAQDDKPKRLRVWRAAEQAGKVMLVVDKDVTPAEGYVHQNVDGLAPGHRYHYAFFDGDGSSWTARSRIGTFRTAFPDDCVQPLTIAATSCTHVGRYPVFKTLQYMAKQDVDAFCHTGDMSYNDGARTKAEFREKWKKTLSAPGYPEVFASAGMYATWDDHESTNNDKLYDETEEFRKTAREAYLETVALPQRPDRIFWANYRWGKSVEFFVLDCRGERKPDEKIYISKAQMDWLKDGLKNSPCHFKAVLNSVPIISWPPLWNVASDDRWDGYVDQRNELLDHITNNSIKNVWFLGGDYHIGVVARVEREGPRSKLWEIMVGPGGNKPPSVLDPLLANLGKNREAVAPEDQFIYFKGQPAATLVTFDPVKDNVRIQFIDPETETPFFDKTIDQNT